MECLSNEWETDNNFLCKQRTIINHLAVKSTANISNVI
jgi:hypothetical protein